MEFSDALRTLGMLRDRGLSVELAEGKVRVRPAALLDDSIRGLIRRDRDAMAEILAVPDRDEPPNLLATEPPPDPPDGWTMADWLDWIRAGGDPRPAFAPRMEAVA